jgi:hypothetical protein
MMRMGCPACGHVEVRGRSVFSGRLPRKVATAPVMERAARISGMGKARVQHISGGVVVDRYRHIGVIEVVQGVIDAAQQLARDRQGGAFAVASGGHLLVVAVVR